MKRFLYKLLEQRGNGWQTERLSSCDHCLHEPGYLPADVTRFYLSFYFVLLESSSRSFRLRDIESLRQCSNDRCDTKSIAKFCVIQNIFRFFEFPLC